MTDRTVAQPVTAIRMGSAQLAIAATAVFMGLYALLHVVKSDVAPTWNTSSEYAIGAHGWLMVVAFLAHAVGCVALFVAVKAHVSTLAGRIGLGVLLLAAAGAAVGGVFVADPIVTPQDELTTSGTFHGMGAGLAMFALPLAALIISVSLARKNPTWSSVRKPLLVAAGLTVAGLIAFLVTNAIMLPSDGQYGPDVLVGIPDRIMQIVNSAWVIAVAWWATKLSPR